MADRAAIGVAEARFFDGLDGLSATRTREVHGSRDVLRGPGPRGHRESYRFDKYKQSVGSSATTGSRQRAEADGYRARGAP